MNKTKNNKQPLNPKVIHFGIDYVRLVFSKNFHSQDIENFFVGMSANSPYREVDWYGYHFTVDYTFSGSRRTLKFTHKDFPILYICSYIGSNSVMSISYMIDVYSTAFYKELFKAIDGITVFSEPTADMALVSILHCG